MAVIKCFIGLIIILLSQNICIFALELECYECDTTNPACTQNPQEVKLTTCAKDENECFVSLDKDGRNIRGCLKSGQKCDETNNCSRCGDKKCNHEKYPTDRIECVICNDCKTPPENSTLLCEIYKKDDKCYTYFDSVNITRGCSSKKDTLSESNPEYYKECENKNHNVPCNIDKIIDLQCFKCEDEKDCKRSDSDEKCTINIKDHEDCKVDEKNNMALCYTQRKSNNVVARGCAVNVNITKEIVKGLTFCKGDNCNSECEVDIQCPICQEYDDPTCSKSEKQDSWYTNKCKPYTTSCHTCLNLDRSTVRGCGKPENNMTICNYCYQNTCLADVPGRICYKCDKTDPKCSRLPTTSEIEFVDCKDDYTQCFTKLNDNIIERGCAKTSETCGDNSKDICKICNENKCNIDILPANRRLCYQCDSETTKNCAEPAAKDATLDAYPCQIYKENDRCYTTYKDINTMIRGCSSDPLKDQNRDKCEKNPDLCVHCDDDKCNNLSFKSTNLLCIQCNDTDTNCVWEQNATTAQNCEPTEFWKPETCFTYIESITNVTRGCTNDENNNKYDCDDISNEKCKKCNTTGCNYENYGQQSCYRCRSDVDTECSHNKLKYIKPLNCRNTVLTSNDQGCFTEKYYNGIIFRGCLVDLDPKTRANCRNKDYKYCTYCEGRNCNDGKVPGDSSVHYISFIVLITSCILYLIM